jgi:hypothetical protein
LKKILSSMSTVKEDASAVVNTTTSVGNSSSYGGRANYAPKMGNIMSRYPINTDNSMSTNEFLNIL